MGNLSTIPPFHLSTFKDPVDTVIRVLYPFALPQPFQAGGKDFSLTKSELSAELAEGSGWSESRRVFGQAAALKLKELCKI